jgi:sugar phosphate isomerase/epimerase
MNRRDFLAAGSAGILAGRAARGAGESPAARPSLGIVEHSYSQRHALGRKTDGRGLLDDPAAFLDLARDRGAAGVQMSLSDKKLGNAAGEKPAPLPDGAFFEGACDLPRNRTQVERFVRDLDALRRRGAAVVRTVAIPGRRYERFKDRAAFRAAAEQARFALGLARAVLQESQFSGIRLAVENHKDWQAEELVRTLQGLDSPQIGVCLDTGNSIALLEDPMETVERLAPWTLTVHLKDMAVETYDDGFLLSEVPLGKGFLDLPRIVAAVRKERPDVRFNLEMITRDPLQVPCLTQDYWATFEGATGWPLARTLRTVRRNASKTPLPRPSALSPEERVRVEDDNVRACLKFAREALGLTA